MAGRTGGAQTVARVALAAEPADGEGGRALPPVANELGYRPRALRWTLLPLALLPALGAAGLFLELGRHGAGTLAIAAALLAVGAVTGLVAWRQSRALAHPLRLLTRRARQLAARHAGHYQVAEGSELDGLLLAFDAMVQALLGKAAHLEEQRAAEAQTGLELQRRFALMQMLRNLALAGSDGDTLERTLENSLREIGDYLDWPVGRLVLLAHVTPGQGDAPRSFWHAPNAQRFAPFIEATNRTRETGSDGLIGRARESHLTHWFSDLSALEDWPRRDAALATGLRTGFVIPIALGDDADAFVEFFSDHRIEANEEMLELIEAISVALWRNVNRPADRGEGAGVHERHVLAGAAAMDLAAAVIGPNGLLEWANPALQRLAGRDGAGLLGRDFAALLFAGAPDSADAWRLHRDAAKPVAGLVLAAPTVQGTARWLCVDLLALPGRTEHSARCFVTVRDVTQERARTEALQRALAQAEAGSLAKSRFLADMRGQVHRPLADALGACGPLRTATLPAPARDAVQTLEAACNALAGVVDDIVDTAAADAGQLVIEAHPVPLRDLVEDLAAALAPRAFGRQIELACGVAADVPGEVTVDAVRLRQLLQRLLVYCIDATRRGEVVLAVDRGLPAGAAAGGDALPCLRLRVRDSSAGLRPEALERLFSLDPADRAHGHLSLALAGRLARLLGGALSVRSRIAEGTEFCLELPLAGTGAAPPAIPVALRRQRILVVDDNATARGFLDARLNAWGMDSAIAENGRQALQMLRLAARSASPFDLALIDARMPLMPGSVIVHAAREDPALAAVRLVMLQPPGMGEAAADASLVKPVRSADLLALLRQPAPVALALGAPRRPGAAADERVVPSPR